MTKIKTKLIVIVGPTASGKSDLAIRLARRYNGEIISADSRQVYRGLDIGTGKVFRQRHLPVRQAGIRLRRTKDFYSQNVRHHLIDVADPKRIFTVSQFKKLAERAIADILKREKLPIIVGGTGQYIDTLVYDIALPKVPPNRRLRAKLEKQTTEQLFARLQNLDPERAQNIDHHNPRRLIRALEIINLMGKVPSLNTRQTEERPSFGRALYMSHNTRYDVLWLGLNPKYLQKRIVQRLDQRFRQGMIAEVKKLTNPLHTLIRANKGMKGARVTITRKRLFDLGLEYRWIGEYLKNKISKNEMRSGLKQAIHQYSKRQMTWFKRNKEIHWNKGFKETMTLVDKFIQRDIMTSRTLR